MGDDIGSGLVCFDFRRSAALHCWVCTFRAEDDLKRQYVTELEPMSSPINYPAYFRQVVVATKQKWLRGPILRNMGF